MRTYVSTYLLCVYYFSEEGEDKMSHYSIIVLGISTLGTSVLLWWLYKYFSGKDKYNVEGMYSMYALHKLCILHVCMCECAYRIYPYRSPSVYFL